MAQEFPPVFFLPAPELPLHGDVLSFMERHALSHLQALLTRYRAVDLLKAGLSYHGLLSLYEFLEKHQAVHRLQGASRVVSGPRSASQ